MKIHRIAVKHSGAISIRNKYKDLWCAKRRYRIHRTEDSGIFYNLTMQNMPFNECTAYEMITCRDNISGNMKSHL